ncbi:hypothetical protein GCM10023206_32750 [Acinetobacter puyangensis]
MFFICIIIYIKYEYVLCGLFGWDKIKRQKNLQKHGLDFADVKVVFDQPLVLFEDTRINYGEQRMVAIGL